jgi:hypothetical protein
MKTYIFQFLDFRFLNCGAADGGGNPSGKDAISPKIETRHCAETHTFFTKIVVWRAFLSRAKPAPAKKMTYYQTPRGALPIQFEKQGG